LDKLEGGWQCDKFYDEGDVEG